MTRRKLQNCEIDIHDFSKDGHGIGCQQLENGQQRIIEVPFGIPGDKSLVQPLRKRRGIFESYLEALVSPSPERIPPRCTHFGLCGGCRWQHREYSRQLAHKEETVKKYFHRYAKDDLFKSIIPCDPQWHYRNKMEFSFSGNKFLGLYANRGRVFNLTECHLVNPWFADTLKAVKDWWEHSALEAYHPFRNTGSLRTLTLREGMNTGDRMVIVTVSGNADYALDRAQLEGFVAAVKSIYTPGQLSIFLRIHQALKGQPTQFYEMLLSGPEYLTEKLRIQGKELVFNVSPMAFFQPNTRQAEKLYSAVLDLIDPVEKPIVYDLYCGTGTLGLSASFKASQVIGIELSREAVLDARSNVKANFVENFSILQGDVGTVLSTEDLPRPDIVIVDPPRVGLGQGIRQVLNLKAKQIIYVSCNPQTQAQDVEQFLESGYRIVAIQPVDQFPHTIHIENIVKLSLDFR